MTDALESKRQTVLVTGANGFVGRHLCRLLQARSMKVRAALRAPVPSLPAAWEPVEIGEIGPETVWTPALNDVGVVVHLAARVHVMRDRSGDPLRDFRIVNTEGTIRLAEQSAMTAVRRFIYISTIKVNGEFTHGVPFGTDDPPDPQDPYAVSKWEAEQGLREIAEKTGMEVVIIRPPLIYGPGVKANFLNMMRWVYAGIPLPLGGIDNRRSLVALDNLIDLITTCLRHPGAANQTFLISDDEDLSTPELLRRLARAMGMSARIFPVPVWMLKSIATLAGKQALARRLLGSLQVDIRKTRELLDWSPPVTVDEGLCETSRHFLERYGK